jgi:hypothetical protein
MSLSCERTEEEKENFKSKLKRLRMEKIKCSCNCHVNEFKFIRPNYPGVKCCDCKDMSYSRQDNKTDIELFRLKQNIERLEKYDHCRKEENLLLENNLEKIKLIIDKLQKELGDIIPRVWSAEHKGCIAMDAIEGNGRFKNKTPHKCPVCDGLGYWPVKLLTKDDDLKKSLTFKAELKCHTCEGKGIVFC